MRRTCLLFLLATSTAYGARVAPQPQLTRMLWGHTGFAVNNTTDDFVCRPVELTVGVRPITLAGGGALSGTGAFAGIIAPDPVPASGTWKVAGIKVQMAGFDYIWNVTAKASNDAVTVARGGAAPTETGTTSTWSYWNTTCWRGVGTSGLTTALAKQLSTPFSVSNAVPYYSTTVAPLMFGAFGAGPGGAAFPEARSLQFRWVMGGAEQDTVQWTNPVFSNSVTTNVRQISIGNTNRPEGLRAFCGSAGPCTVLTTWLGVAAQVHYPVTFVLLAN